MSVGTVDENEASIDQLIKNQLADQRRNNEEFNAQFNANRERLAKVFDEASKTRIKINDPTIGELVQLLSEAPMLTANVLEYAKRLKARVQAAMAKELELPT
jgi:hypothetical protein